MEADRRCQGVEAETAANPLLKHLKTPSTSPPSSSLSNAQNAQRHAVTVTQLDVWQPHYKRVMFMGALTDSVNVSLV